MMIRDAEWKQQCLCTCSCSDQIRHPSLALDNFMTVRPVDEASTGTHCPLHLPERSVRWPCRAKIVSSNRTWMEHCKWIMYLQNKPLLCDRVTPHKESLEKLWQTPQHLRDMYPEADDPAAAQQYRYHQPRIDDVIETACRTWCLRWVREMPQNLATGIL